MAEESAATPADVNADVKPESITIVVKDQQGGEVQFKIKQNTKFKKVLAAYCQKKGVVENSVKFLFDGKRVHSEETPLDLELEEGDFIDAVIDQIGGVTWEIQQSMQQPARSI